MIETTHSNEIIPVPEPESTPPREANSPLQTALTGLGLLVVFLLALAYVQWGTTALTDTDSYYHMKMGYLIRQEGLKVDFPYLPLTVLREGAFYDHHLLYHLYLSLFATVDPALDNGRSLTQAGKVAAIIWPALAFVLFWALIRAQKVRWPAIWALGLLAVSYTFLYRMSMTRAQSASLFVLFLAVHWLLQKRYWLMLPLGFAYVWLYNAFPLLLVVVGCYFVAEVLYEGKWPWTAVLYAVAGIALGLLINPYFPENITFIINHFLPKLNGSDTPVGNEWYPYDSWVMVGNAGFSLLAFVLGAFGMGWRKERMSKATLFALGLAFVFAVMFFKSRRFIEYFPAFAWLFAVLAFSPLVEEWAEWMKKQWLSALPVTAVLFLAIALPAAYTLQEARRQVSNALPADRFAEAMAWMNSHTSPGTFVFQTDWDDFPRLFFYDTNAVYTNGLDPTYMELAEPELYAEWVRITKGNVAAPGADIRERFHAQYVITDLDHKSFMEKADKDPDLEEVYRDEHAVIYAVH